MVCAPHLGRWRRRSAGGPRGRQGPLPPPSLPPPGARALRAHGMQGTSVRGMTTRSLTTLFPGGSYFEGPRWHDGAWWVSDFYTHQVTRITPDGQGTVVAEVEQQPSGLGWLPDGS